LKSSTAAFPQGSPGEKDSLLFHQRHLLSQGGARRGSVPEISLNNLEFKLEGISVRDRVQLCIVPDVGQDLAEIRVWCDNRFVGLRKINSESLKLVHF
jgi:hypothetical protein